MNLAGAAAQSQNHFRIRSPTAKFFPSARRSLRWPHAFI